MPPAAPAPAVRLIADAAAAPVATVSVLVAALIIAVFAFTVIVPVLPAKGVTVTFPVNAISPPDEENPAVVVPAVLLLTLTTPVLTPIVPLSVTAAF